MPDRYKMPDRYRGMKYYPDRDKTRKGPSYPCTKLINISYNLAQTSYYELLYLYDVSTIIEGNLIVELGCYKGFSATALAMGLRDSGLRGKVYTVDLYDNPKNKISAVKNFHKYNIEKYVEICHGSSKDYSKKLSHILFDFIFIDADHSYESCKEDFECWSPLLKNNGLISFHDCHLNSVNQVLEEIQDAWVLVDHYELLKTFRRKT